MRSELIEFVKARLDEDDKAARAAIAARWREDGPIAIEIPLEAAEHYMRHYPERTLRDIEGKRQLLELIETFRVGADLSGNIEDVVAYCALISLARPYADHRDFDQDWLEWIAP